jgi:hypothetical protein
MATVANVMPTKDFFINMLTRDIELSDAILDLLDNCLDGVVRIKNVGNKWDDMNYYNGYKAELKISATSFVIEDNCGGISRKIAEEKAFRMGKSDYDDNGLPTVGIYGIGMKRAIFKIGKAASVKTKNDGKAYTVKIEEDWAKNDNWTFPITGEQPELLPHAGTTIEITSLNENIKKNWEKDSLDIFVDELIEKIKANYSLIIQKGFKIYVNSENPVEALPIELLISKGEAEIQPYIYKAIYNGVDIRLAVGFYASPPSDDDIDEENESRRTSGDAGWTVVCNDRVVIYNDKSYLTGWGEADVPQYHTQFIGIRGIVIFQSNNPQNLPMTTTKRGIDLSSSVYFSVKNKMREGLKLFTNYTNQWKGRNTLEREHSTKADKVPFVELFDDVTLEKYDVKLRKDNEGSRHKPVLPKPPNDKNYVIIRFAKAKDDVEKVSVHFTKDSSIKLKASEVGGKCFDIVLKKISGASKV